MLRDLVGDGLSFFRGRVSFSRVPAEAGEVELPRSPLFSLDLDRRDDWSWDRFLELFERCRLLRLPLEFLLELLDVDLARDE